MQPLILTARETLSPRITRFRFEHPEGRPLPLFSGGAHVMVEMQDACFCSSGSTLKPCLRTVTPSAPPLVGIFRCAIHDRKGYSLPKNQTPSVLPLKSSGLVMPLSLRQVSIMPEDL